MRPTVILFDCAGTLLWTDFVYLSYAMECAEEAGGPVNEADRFAYNQLLQENWTRYEGLNLGGKPEVLDAFWLDLTSQWLALTRKNPELAKTMSSIAKERLLSHFELFDDTLAVLTSLKKKGYRLGVVSNWDYTLFPILNSFGLDEFFEVALASLVEGVEKPDRRLFEIALARLGCSADQCVYIGDDLIDDVQGPINAGVPFIFLDRDHSKGLKGSISTLSEL